jgi:hypothetical protein
MPRNVNIPTESTVSVTEGSLRRAYEEYRSLKDGGTLSSESFAVVNKALKEREDVGIVEIRPGEEGRDLYGLTSGGDNPFSPFLSAPASDTQEEQDMPTGNRRPGESVQEYAERLGVTDGSGSAGDPVEQARRLVSGAGGGPSGTSTTEGGAVGGVDPSAGSTPGTEGSVLPTNFEGSLPGPDGGGDPTPTDAAGDRSGTTVDVADAFDLETLGIAAAAIGGVYLLTR